MTYLLLFRFLYYHQEHDLGTLEGTLGDAGIGTLGAQKIVTVHASETVRKALRLMHEHEISGIPVLNDEGVLMDMYCDADVLQLPDLDLDLNVGLALEQVLFSHPPLPLSTPPPLSSSPPPHTPYLASFWLCTRERD